MEGITLYTNGCPKCNILKEKLDNKNIKYNIINDIKIVREKGFMAVPLLEVNNKIMTFLEANNFINSL